MTLVIIPVRMNSTRLPGKFLELIGKKTVLQHCIDRAHEAGLAPWVATDSEEIIDSLNGKCPHVLTGVANCGTDRVAMAAELIDPDRDHELVVNFQGDMPFIDPEHLKSFVQYVESGIFSGTECFTALCELKLVEANAYGQFRRTTVNSHIGLYGYTRAALRTFAATPQSEQELAQSLEQLRCPEKFTWGYMYFASMPIEINKKIDLEEVRRCRL